MSEIHPFSPAAPPGQPTPSATQNTEGPSAGQPLVTPPPMPANGGKDPIETFLANGRLQINANVGLEGIGRLKQMLEKYEELIKLMN